MTHGKPDSTGKIPIYCGHCNSADVKSATEHLLWTCGFALAGIANPEKLGELLEVCQRLVRNEGRVAFRDQCAWFDDVKAALAAIGALPAGDAS